MKHKKFFGVATEPQTVLVKNFMGLEVCFALPFEVEVGKCVMISFEEIEDERLPDE